MTFFTESATHYTPYSTKKNGNPITENIDLLLFVWYFVDIEFDISQYRR